MIEEWRTGYNPTRPHSSLGYLAPQTFRHTINSRYPWYDFRGKITRVIYNT